MKKNTIDMTSGSPAKHIQNFTVPLILTNMGQQLYMIVDGAIVGCGVGVKALAAVGVTDWCYWLILWTVGGLAQGFSTFVSRAFGEHNYPEMNKIIATATDMILSFPILHILHVFRNVLQALGISTWSLMSGFAEVVALVWMSQFLIGYIGANALLLSEPASWPGAMLCVFLSYFYYRKKLLR